MVDMELLSYLEPSDSGLGAGTSSSVDLGGSLNSVDDSAVAEEILSLFDN